MRILIPLLFIVLNNAQADCSKKDLTDPVYLKSIGKEKLVNHFKKPRDQDSVGWFGAYATSDSLSFAVGEAISSVDISINFFADNTIYKNDKLNQLESINLLSSSDIAKKIGYCPESVIPSNKTLTSNLGNKDLINLMVSFQNLFDIYNSQAKPDDYCIECTSIYKNSIKPSLPKSTGTLIKEVLKNNQNSSLLAFKDLLDKLCEGRRIKVDTKVDVYNNWNKGDKTFTSLVEDALDNNSMPSIGINSSHFINPIFTNSGNFDHAMVIVAKRMGKDNKCEYLFRNSYGRGCEYYKKELANKCDANKGTFWMGKDELENGVMEVLVIKNEKTQIEDSIPKPTPTLTLKSTEDLKIKNEESNQSFVNTITKSVSSIWQLLTKSFKY